MVNVIEGAGKVLHQVSVPVLARSQGIAMNQAERFINMATPRTQWGEAISASQIFPPPSGPTAVAV
jgi:endonuclease V-like protein UPF0215 family